MLQRIIGLFLVLPAATLAVAAESPRPGAAAIRVECHGVLRHGLTAIGGESTGTTLKYDGVTWELQLPDAASRAFAAAHHKQPVAVSGALRRVQGVEVPVRWIIDVERLSEPDSTDPYAGGGVTFAGKLRTGVDVGAETTAVVIEAGGVSWELDLSADKTLQERAAALNQKPVVVQGRMERVPEAANSARMIIRVNKLDAPAGAAGKSPK